MKSKTQKTVALISHLRNLAILPITLALLHNLLSDNTNFTSGDKLSPSTSLRTGESTSAEVRLKWSQLPSLPDRYGFAGMFSGISNGALILAGGTNFPEEEWGKGTKTWYSDIWVLEAHAKEWIHAGKLPHPADTGVSVTTKWGIIMAGGLDDKGCYSCVHLVRWNSAEKKLEIIDLPDMPEPRGQTTGGLLDNAIYVACGALTSGEKGFSKTLFQMKLPSENISTPDWQSLRWEKLEALPGPERAEAVSAVQDGRLYVFSGYRLLDSAPNGGAPRARVRGTFGSRLAEASGVARVGGTSPKLQSASVHSELRRDTRLCSNEAHSSTAGRPPASPELQRGEWPPVKAGEIHREYLTDTYAYKPGKGWKRIADVPHPVVAAPAIGYGDSHILVVGGHDGQKMDLISVLKDKWQFQRDMFAYDTITDTWKKIGETPDPAAVKANPIIWHGKIIIPSGEIGARIRTNRMLQIEIVTKTLYKAQ